MSQVDFNTWPFAAEAPLIEMKDWFVLTLCSKLACNLPYCYWQNWQRQPAINALLYPAKSKAAIEWIRCAAAFGPVGQKCPSMWQTHG